MTHGAKHLKFRCTECGACCHEYRVPLTGADLRTLMRRVAPLEPETLLEWIAPAAVDMTGEPETFVELPEGRRLLVLRHQQGACHFLRDKRCSVHEARPRSCRLYPWDVTLGRRGGVRRLRLLYDFPSCEATWDGHVHPLALAEQKRLERAELEQYVRWVSEWNLGQRRRRRLGKPLLASDVFIRRLLQGRSVRHGPICE